LKWLQPCARDSIRGLNTLTFQVTNAPFAGTNPSGLRYEFLHAAAEPLPQ
jgi:hypothetical protein